MFSRLPLRNLIFFLTWVALILQFFLISGYVTFLLVRSKSKLPADLHHEIFEYQFAEINPFRETDETKFGFTKLDRKLSEEEYVSYSSSNTGDLFIISNYGGMRYKCTGTCYCDDEGDTFRRRASSSTSSILRNGLVVILSAFSITVATNMAKEAFQNDCLHQFSEQCSESAIQSSVESCEEDDKIETGENEEENSKFITHFMCRGNCMPNPKFNDKKAIEMGMDKHKVKGFDCESIEMKKHIVVDESKAETGGWYDRMYYFVRSKLGLLTARRDEAMMTMRYQHLKPFCKTVKIQDPLYDRYGVDICISETQVVHMDRSKIKCLEQGKK